METKIGLTVVYKTTLQDREKMEAAQILKGGCNVQDFLPAIITHIWDSDTVNLRVITDGNLDLWITSVPRGSVPGSWDNL